MSEDEIRDALERAAEVVPDKDLSHTAWYAGRSRKRRTSRAWWGAGGMVAAAALVGAIAWNGGALSLPDSDPAGTATDEAAQTSTAGPTLSVDDPAMSGHLTVLEFTGGEEDSQPTGILEPWTPGAMATSWLLLEQIGPEGSGISLSFDGTTWSVRGCGLAMQAPGSVAGGRVQVTGAWDIDPDPDPEMVCTWHPWLDPDRWESFLGGTPLAAKDGSTLLLNGSFGQEPVLARASVGFTRSDATSPQVGPARAATWEDLTQAWVEAPLDDLRTEIPDRAFVDTETDPEAAVQLRSPGARDLTITGCDADDFLSAWLLDTGAASLFLDAHAVFDASGCDGPGARQQSLVTTMLGRGAEISIHGDYLIIDSWVDPRALDPQPTVEDARPELLNAPTQLPDLKQLSQADTLLPEVLEVPADGIPTLVEDPTDSFVTAVVPEDENSALLVLGSDQRWRTAATEVGLVYPSPQLLRGGSPPLLDSSISPQGDRLAYRTDVSIVIVAASTGEVIEYGTDGEYPDTVPDDFLWLDDNRLAVDLREDHAMIIDTSTGEVTHDASWSQLREITPWRIAVQHSDDDPSGPVVLQQRDTAGELVDEIPLGFEGTTEGGAALAQDRVATVITTEDRSVIEPEGWQGEVPESVSLVLAYDGTDHYVNLLQAGPHTVTPVRWVDRGTLIVQVTSDGPTTHYVLWDTQNGGLNRLTHTNQSQFRAGPVFAQSAH